MNLPPPRAPLSRLLSPGSVALLYAALAMIWILASGSLLTMNVADPVLQGRIEMAKGLLFVLVTSVLLYSILRAWLHQEPQPGDVATPPPFRRSSVLLVAAVLLGTVPLAGVLVLRTHSPQVEREALANLGAVADLKVAQVRRWLDERCDDAGLLKAQAAVAGKALAFLRNPASKALENEARVQLLGATRGLQYDDVALVTPMGRSLLEIGSYRLAPTKEVTLRVILGSGLSRFCGLTLDPDGRPYFDLVAPLRNGADGQGDVVGAVILRNDPQRVLFPVLDQWPAASTSGKIFLLRYEGERAVFVKPPSTARDAGASLFARDPAMRSPEGWSVRGDDDQGVATFAALRPIAGTGWYVAAKIDRDEVMAPLRDLASWISVVTFLGIAVVGAVMLAFWRQHAHAQRLELQAHSNRLLQQFYDLPFIGLSMTSPESRRWMRCNDRFCEILGYSREELLTLSWKDLTHPEDMPSSEIENERILRGESDGFAMDKRFVRKDGQLVHARIEVRCVRRADGSPDYMLAMLDDISGRKAAEARIERLTRTYAALSECNQSIVRCRDEDELLPRICRIAVELGGMNMAWVGMIDSATGMILPVARYGGSSDWLDRIQVSSVEETPLGRGSAGKAIREKRAVWIGDFQHDPVTAPWHDVGRKAGWVGSCALPLEREGEIVGAFMLYSGDVAAFDDDQRKLLAEMATDIGFAMTTFARERARQKAEASLDRLTHMYAALSECNQAIVRCSSEEELFPQVCRFAVQHGGMKMAWVGRFDPLARCVEPVAGFGDGTDFLDGVRISTDLQQSPLAHGVTASAVRERRPFWIQDYLTDYRTTPWHEHAVRAGWGGVAAFPLTRGETVHGVLTLYAGEVGAFDEDILKLMAEMALDISFALDLFARAAERQHMEEQLRLSAQVFEQGGEGIMITDAQARVLRVNRAFETITGYRQDEVAGRNPRFLSSGRHGREFYRTMWDVINADGFWQGEVWNRRKDGDIYPEYLSVSRVVDDAGEATHFIGTFNDISESKASQEHIQRLAHYDSLTGLPNRALLADRVELALSSMERNGEQLALIFLDLDRFKNVNDSLGHRVGDELLVQVAGRLKDLLREEDTVSRLGGDEFILVLPGTDADGAAHVAGKVLKALSAPYRIEQHELSITPSMGLALYPADGETYEALSRSADTAMYRAKQSGRQTFRFFTREMQERSDRLLQLENALRRSLEFDQLHLHFQPQISLDSGRVIGVEALLRWRHPEMGDVSPADFIPVAEDSGMILPIGEWVLRTAARQLRTWLDRGLPPMVMAVNLSAIQFRQPNLPQIVAQIVAESGLPPDLLELELTEGVAMENPLEAIAVMSELNERGLRMSIDDFGTGYSSLNYLKRFRVYKLKIDQSFVRDISRDPDDEAIVGAIIGLARSLGLQTIAEGVETEEQAAFLKTKGCDEVQGYLYSRPMTADAFERYVRAVSG